MRLPSIIDLEASGFGAESYPIEIGIVRHDGARFCRLIKPSEEWLHWDSHAEELHGITQESLRSYGSPIVEVCTALNEFMAGERLYSDGWVVDSPWLNKLYAQAGIEMTFAVSPLESLLNESQLKKWDDTKKRIAVEYGGSRHRASVDAMIIQQTVIALNKQQQDT